MCSQLTSELQMQLGEMASCVLGRQPWGGDVAQQHSVNACVNVYRWNSEKDREIKVIQAEANWVG